LLKTSKAAKELQEKLQHERHKVAALEEERTQLHTQLLRIQQQSRGMDPKEVGNLINDLASARSKVERLIEERASLSQQLSALKNEMSESSALQKEVLMQAETEAQNAMKHEQERCEQLQSDMDNLLEKLQQSSQAAESVEESRQALQEVQARYAELKVTLEEEQNNAYMKSMELENLAQAAQACANELMDVREELAEEKTKTQRLLNQMLVSKGESKRSQRLCRRRNTVLKF